MSIVKITGKKGQPGIPGEQGATGRNGQKGVKGQQLIYHSFIVKVESDKSGNNIFSIDELPQKKISLFRGQTYKFDQTHYTNLDDDGNLIYPLYLYKDLNTKLNFAEHSDNHNIHEFKVPLDLPEKIYYSNTSDNNMGGSIDIMSFIPDLHYNNRTNTNTNIIIEYTKLGGSINKANLEEKYQPIIGMSSKYTVSGGDILNGQPMIQDFTNGIISATGISDTVPPAWKFIGIATNSAASGNVCTIVHDGFVTARFKSLPPIIPDSYTFNDETNNIHRLYKETTFETQHNTKNTHYQITFDAGEGSVLYYNIRKLNFPTTDSLAIRLGWEYSNDNTTYITPSLNGFHKSKNNVPPYSEYFNSYDGYDRTVDTSGQIFPYTENFILEHDGSLEGTFYSRYIRFHFKDDFWLTALYSWEIVLNPFPNSTPTGSRPVVNTPLYLHPDDLTKVFAYTDTDTDTNNTLVGYCASENTDDNDSIYMRVSTNKF